MVKQVYCTERRDSNRQIISISISVPNLNTTTCETQYFTTKKRYGTIRRQTNNMRRTATPSFSSLSSATISIKCLLILLVVSLSILLIAPIQVVQGTIEVEEEEPIQALSTGENPSDFVRNKIDSHDVSTAYVLC